MPRTHWAGVAALLVFALAALELTVMPMSVRPDELVADAKLGGSAFKQRRNVPLGVGETIRKLEAVVRLDPVTSEDA